jgi:hypothetical protein
MGVINVDWYWIYVLDSWEGSAHDGQVFNDTLLRGLQVFECRYYLGGAIYMISSVCSGPPPWCAIPSQGMEESQFLKMKTQFSI